MFAQKTKLGAAAVALAFAAFAVSPAVAGDSCGMKAGGADAAEKSSAAAAGKKDIVDVATSAGDFNTLAAALKAAGLVDTLKGAGPFTVFAPTDAAFKKLPAGTVEDLLKPENKQKLTSILTYHVASGAVGSSEVAKLDSVKTVNGKSVSIKAEGGTVKVGSAQVTKADIKASNGVIHVIDTVLLPE